MTLWLWLPLTLAALLLVAVLARTAYRRTLHGRMRRVANGTLSAPHDADAGPSSRTTCIGCGWTSDGHPVRYTPHLGAVVHGCRDCGAVWTTDSHLTRRTLR